MTYKWIDQEEFDEEAEKLDIIVGNYNTFPEPSEEIAWQQALVELHADHMGPAKFTDHKQCNLPGTEGRMHWDVTLYLWADKCIAVAKWFTYDLERDKEERGLDLAVGKGVFVNKHEHGKYGGYVIRFYRIGCKHPKLYEMSADEVKERGGKHWGMFDHHYLCPDCGFTRRTDSSG